MTDDIAGWRTKIDEIDKSLLKLLNERAGCAIEIGKIKARKNLPVYDPHRESAVLARLRELNNGPLSDKAIEELFRFLIERTREIETQE